MSLPSAREVFEKSSENNETAFDAMESYIYFLEQQHKEMLDALCGIHDKVIGMAWHQDWHSEDFRQKFQAMQAAIESATGLPIDMAIERWEEGK